MSVIELSNLRNGYVDLVDWVMSLGEPVTSRGLPTTELTGVTIEVPRPIGVMLPVGVNRRVNQRLAAVETLQLLSGTGDVNLLLRASPGYVDVMVNPEHAGYGAYGPRLRYQLSTLIGLLRREPDTRRAVLTIWREDDLSHNGDRPCTLTLQFLVRSGRLELIVNMRSQDVWLGVPYDLFMFTQLQRSIACTLGVGTGRYTHHVGSLHLYDRDVEAARRLTYTPDDRPAPVNYPDGVRVVHGGDHPTEVAGRLLDGTFDDDEAAVNPWYVRQLAELYSTVDEGGKL